MDLGLKDRSVIVLAASRGLGRAVATEFAREGAKVTIASRDADRLGQAAEAIAAETGGTVIAQPCDVTSHLDMEMLFDRAVREHGDVDVLVNNSGGPKAGTFETLSDEDWHAAHELTLISFMRAIRMALPLMRERGGGRVVNMTSLTVRQPMPNLLLSNVYRAGVAGMTKSLSTEFAAENILLNTVGPGFISTDRTKELMEYRAETQGITIEEATKAITDSIPMGRMGDPAELARAVVWLGSFANTYLTGQVVIVDGGMVKSI